MTTALAITDEHTDDLAFVSHGEMGLVSNLMVEATRLAEARKRAPARFREVINQAATRETEALPYIPEAKNQSVRQQVAVFIFQNWNRLKTDLAKIIDEERKRKINNLEHVVWYFFSNFLTTYQLPQHSDVSKIIKNATNNIKLPNEVDTNDLVQRLLSCFVDYLFKDNKNELLEMADGPNVYPDLGQKPGDFKLKEILQGTDPEHVLDTDVLWIELHRAAFAAAVDGQVNGISVDMAEFKAFLQQQLDFNRTGLTKILDTDGIIENTERFAQAPENPRGQQAAAGSLATCAGYGSYVAIDILRNVGFEHFYIYGPAMLMILGPLYIAWKYRSRIRNLLKLRPVSRASVYEEAVGNAPQYEGVQKLIQALLIMHKLNNARRLPNGDVAEDTPAAQVAAEAITLLGRQIGEITKAARAEVLNAVHANQVHSLNIIDAEATVIE